VTPAFVVMSQGVLASDDKTDSAGLSANYPAQDNTQTSPPSPTTDPQLPTIGEPGSQLRPFACLCHVQHP